MDFDLMDVTSVLVDIANKNPIIDDDTGSRVCFYCSSCDNEEHDDDCIYARVREMLKYDE